VGAHSRVRCFFCTAIWWWRKRETLENGKIYRYKTETSLNSVRVVVKITVIKLFDEMTCNPAFNGQMQKVECKERGECMG
jgi:hypothetical protein